MRLHSLLVGRKPIRLEARGVNLMLRMRVAQFSRVLGAR